MQGSRPSLRILLTVPYVVLVLGLAGIIGALSYVAGRDAVDNLSGLRPGESVVRGSGHTDRKLAGSTSVTTNCHRLG